MFDRKMMKQVNLLVSNSGEYFDDPKDFTYAGEPIEGVTAYVLVHLQYTYVVYCVGKTVKCVAITAPFNGFSEVYGEKNFWNL